MDIPRRPIILKERANGVALGLFSVSEHTALNEANMTLQSRILFSGLAMLLVAPALVMAAPKRPSIATGSAKPDPNAKTVEMFAAMESGDINVQLIPKNAEEARVLVKNNTRQPLRIEMPAAFAGVPVLAQFGGGNQGGGGFGGGNQGGGNQGMGGGMGGGMMGGGMGGGGMGGMGGGGGFFNVAPEKVGQIKVGLLCLEHGKKDPRPGIPYEIKPIDALTSNPAVHELLKQFANDKYDQRAAQAAAWHLNNSMSWQQLAGKRIPHLNRPSEPYFSHGEIEAGMRVAQDARIRAEQNSTPQPRTTTMAGEK